MADTTARRSVAIGSLTHLAPIPVATRVGPMLTCSVTAPYDAGTRDCPSGARAQVANLFLHVGNMLEAAGFGWDDVAKMTFYAPDVGAVIPAINAEWTVRFPDPASRPSRHCMAVPTYGDGILACCDFLAYRSL